MEGNWGGGSIRESEWELLEMPNEDLWFWRILLVRYTSKKKCGRGDSWWDVGVVV